MNDTNRPALSRTWAITTIYRECSVVIEVSHETVTLSRDVLGGPLSAMLNGEPVEVARADRLLRNADSRTLTTETLTLSSTIGKARNCGLHKILGRLGPPHPQHYAIAAAALGGWVPVCRL